MKIAYAKKRYQHFMYLGLAWIILGMIQIILISNQWWLGLGWIVLGVVSFSIFLYKKSVPYLILNYEFIKANRPFGQQMKVSDIYDVIYLSNKYILKSKDSEFRINIDYVEENQIEELKQKLLNLIEK